MTLAADRGRWVGGAASLLGLTLGLTAPLTEVSPEIQRSVGIAVFAVICWMTRPVPFEMSSLAVLLLLPAAGLLDFREAFRPFSEPTVWLVFSGMILSQTLAYTELGREMVSVVLRHLGPSPFGLLAALHLLGLAAAFLVPSGVVRVLILLPMGKAIADAIDNGQSRDLSMAILLSLVCSTYFGGSGVLTGCVPNLVVVGQLEATTGRVVYWGEWLRWMFPVFGLARTGLCLVVVWLVVGRRVPRHVLSRPDPATSAVLSTGQRHALWILLAGMAMWSSDSLHRLAPVYVGLILTLACVLPGWGPLPHARMRRVNFPFFFYLAALFSIGSALQNTGFSSGLAHLVFGGLDLANCGWLTRCLAITALAIPPGAIMDLAGVAGIVTPPLLALGADLGMSDISVAMSTGMATNLVFLPYQAAPFMVALAESRLSMGRLAVCTALVSLLSLVLLVPLNILYWRLMGLI